MKKSIMLFLLCAVSIQNKNIELSTRKGCNGSQLKFPTRIGEAIRNT